MNDEYYIASKLSITIPLARDLLLLAGGDVKLVLTASSEGDSLHAVKAYIINERLKRLEEK